MSTFKAQAAHISTALPRGLRENADGSVVCKHRDVSCCDSCRQKHPWLIDVYGVVYFVRSEAERKELSVLL